ncbi:hypothetical protein AB0E27_32175 [Streptomyces sparsogenes]|uniref:hypothetical protein n=1 Tax=Streptomyces sparsogenes TaxID=67365 RepID=UPI0033EF1291
MEPGVFPSLGLGLVRQQVTADPYVGCAASPAGRSGHLAGIARALLLPNRRDDRLLA